jgi:hypothetical protein
MSDIRNYITQHHIRGATELVQYIEQYDLSESPKTLPSTATVLHHPTNAPVSNIQIIYVQGIAMYSDGRYVYCTEDVIRKVPKPTIIGVLIPPDMNQVIFLPQP